MDESYSSIIIIVLVALLLMSHNKSNVDCRSHDSFMFCCHHNDSNTEIYLRRLNDKLDKVFEQIDKTPAEIKEQVAIEEKECKAEFIIGCLFSELMLLRSGKLTTGLLANIIPVCLLDYANREFDHYEDTIVTWHVETFNYTKEEADLLRSTLPQRHMHPQAIKAIAISKIRFQLDYIIEYQIMNNIIEKNNCETPPDLASKVFAWRWKLRHNDPDVAEAQNEIIIKEIEEAKIRDFIQLKNRIREIYLEEKQDAKRESEAKGRITYAKR